MHQALLYEGDREYLDGVMRFIAPALANGEPVAAALPPEQGKLVRQQLSGSGAEIEILDMYEFGAIPRASFPPSKTC